MNPQTAWQRLAAAARRAPDTRGTAAPVGFATRVAALALAQPRQPVSIFDVFSLRISLRVLGAAAALALVTAGVSYPTLARLFSSSTMAAPTVFARPTPAGTDSTVAPAAVESPALDAPQSTPSTGDDPVAELVNIVS